MRSVYLQDQRDELAFIEKAAKWFAENPTGRTYSENDPTEGEFLGIRWGPDLDCILLVKLDGIFIPRNYQSVIPEKARQEQTKDTTERYSVRGFERSEPETEKKNNVKVLDIWNVSLYGGSEGRYLLNGELSDDWEGFSDDVPTITIILEEDLFGKINAARGAQRNKNLVWTFDHGLFRVIIHSFA